MPSKSPFEALLAPDSAHKLTKQQKQLFEQGLRSLDRAKATAAKAKDNAACAGRLALSTAETATTLAVSDFAEGFLKPQHQGKLAAVRTVIGAGGTLAGLGMALFDKGYAKDVVATSSGVLLSQIGSWSRKAGETWRAKRDAQTLTPAVQGHPQPPYALPELDLDPALHTREVKLTPSARGPRPSPGRRRPRRD
ncbi:MAG: hypothetical protein EP330_08600 [Deltaproteobacteria bacterium]|nr:MAG: hypothetical protein EP330_08600 [Deltaproteobacteria bacterium]